MNADQIGGIVRAILTALGGLFVTKGYLTSDTLNTVIGALLTLGGTGWSIYTNRAGVVIPPKA